MKKNPNILNGESIGSGYFVRYNDHGIEEERENGVHDTDVLPFEESAHEQNRHRPNNGREHPPEKEGKRGVDNTNMRNRDASISGASESRCDINCDVV